MFEEWLFDGKKNNAFELLALFNTSPEHEDPEQTQEGAAYET